MYEYRHLTLDQQTLLLKYRKEHEQPWHAPPHPPDLSGTFLLTAANYEHAAIMAKEERRLEIQAMLLSEFEKIGAEVSAWVILPNHYHLLASTPELRVVQSVFQHVHGSTSRKWNLADRTPGRKVWYRYSDRQIRSEGHFLASLNYIHYNPVKHGWVEKADAWLASSIWGYLDTVGRDWLIRTWRSYPIQDFGRGWDEETRSTR